MPTLPPRDPVARVRDEDDRRERETALTRRFRPIVIWLLAAIAIILVGSAMRSLAVVIVPLVVAVFVTLAVLPIDRWVAAQVGRRLAFLGHAAALLVVVLVLSGFFAGIYFAAQQAVGQMPDITSGFRSMLPGSAAEGSGLPSDGSTAAATADAAPRNATSAAVQAEAEPASDSAQPDSNTGAEGDGPFAGADFGALYDRTVVYLLDHAGALASGVLNAAATLIAGIVLVVFLVLLMLVERETWQAKTKALFSRSSQVGWNDTLAVTARSFRWYIVVRTALGVVSGALYAGWLAVFGVDLLVVWFVLAFLLNYIPTFGSILAALLPVIYVVATEDWTTALIIAAGLVVIEQVLGNYIDPMVQGKQLSVSPVVTFVGLLLFGWMWGVMGALLAMPILVFAVIALAHTDTLKPVALILSDAKDMESLEEKTYR